MTAPHETKERASVAGWSRASRCAGSSRLHQHQKLTRTERGHSWGLCAPIPAVVHDDMQAVRLGRAVDARSFSRNSHRSVVPPCPGRLVGLSAFAGARLITIHHDQHGSRRTVVHSLPAKHVSQNVAYRLHLSASFRKLSSSDGQRTIGKAFDEWTKTNFRIGQK